MVEVILIVTIAAVIWMNGSHIYVYGRVTMFLDLLWSKFQNSDIHSLYYVCNIFLYKRVLFFQRQKFIDGRKSQARVLHIFQE